MISDKILLAAVITVAVGLFMPFAVRPLLTRFTVIDLPSARSSHVRPVLRGAGVAVAAALVAGLLVTLATGGAGGTGGSFTFLVLTTVILTAGLGFAEDAHGVPIGGRLIAQLLIGGLVGGWLVLLSGQVLFLPIAVIVVPVLVNVANFMDGVDNLSGMVLVAFGVAHVILAAMTDAAPDTLAAAGAVAAAAGLGFLPWNNGHHKMFLGDSGSYLIGGAMSVITLGALAAGAPLLAVLGPVAVYLADTAYTLLSRVLRGERWHESHRQHRYHLLEDLGWSHISIAAFVCGTTALTSTLGVLSAVGGVGAVLCAVAMAVVCTAYVALPRMLRSRRPNEVAR
ncbi:UDP-phosphate glycosyltransferase [Frigoribacterium sp. PvP032]|uniref:UDP-phosphate glycosyltransferase n=1 Tax=Frigoribacterium sp. PvP032 TaxID=2806589 RepID=UPI001AE9C9AC|nr:UDP-phosphate glycosyltransferase [Frigoribacterium sp. PvP032]MBP1190433.1 UDP-N-acetylmuramyl pentapeptide phosphotransferase/UDP-N-acetylglucosamine-1-phosphate transferase [Frigoribacterium sp. PvP032]